MPSGWSPVASAYAKSIMEELKVNTENVVYIDEYPELAKRVWLRRLARDRSLGRIASRESELNIIVFPTGDTPDGAA